MQLVINTTAASLAAMSAAQRFAAFVTAVQSAQSADIVLGKILSSIEDTRQDGTLSKYVEKETGITSREIGHAYKACVVFRALTKAGVMPEDVYDRAIPSWVVPASAVINALDMPAHAAQKPGVLAELAALFAAGKKGDDTTARITEIKVRLLGEPEKKPSKAETEKAEMQTELDAAEEKVRQAEENGKAMAGKIAQAEENGRVMMSQLATLQSHGEMLTRFVKAIALITADGIEAAPSYTPDIMQPKVEALPESQTRAALLDCIAARRSVNGEAASTVVTIEGVGTAKHKDADSAPAKAARARRLAAKYAPALKKAA